MLYVLASHTGTFVRWAPTAGELAPVGASQVVLPFPEYDAPPTFPYQWEAATRMWVSSPSPLRVISRRVFMDRFPALVRRMIHRFELENTDIGADVRDWILRFTVVPDVHLDEADTIQSVHEMIGLAVLQNVIPAGDASATIAAILA